MKRVEYIAIFVLLLIGGRHQADAQESCPRIPWYWSAEGFINNQFTYTPSETNTFFIRNARIDLKGFISDKLEFRLQTEFAGQVKVLDAVLKCKFHKGFNVQVGQYKTPFTLESQYHLLKKECIDYAQVINRLSGYNDPLPGNRNNGRDIGIMIYGGLFEIGERPFPLLSYNIGLFNGSGINRKDDNMRKDVIARIDVRPGIRDLVLSASAIAGSYNDGVNANAANRRISFGGEYKSDDLTVRSEYVRADIESAGKTTFSDGFYVVAGYWFDLPGGQRLRPVLRYDTINYTGATSTLCMAGLDWWPWIHLRLQLNCIRSITLGQNTIQAMASVKF
ncbi:MAG: hypothetical protein IJS30_04950 [Bacteroidales bacterium]|nr:hypothetical protein [Bacteroidales bacterium]